MNQLNIDYTKWIKIMNQFEYRLYLYLNFRDKLIYKDEIIPYNYTDFEPLNYDFNKKTRKWIDYKNKKIFYIK